MKQAYEPRLTKLLPAVRVEEDLFLKIVRQKENHQVSVGNIIRTALREHLGEKNK